MSMRRLSRFVKGVLGHGPTKPPYRHIVQLGDPALRAQALPVDVNDINSDHVKEVVGNLVYTMRRYKCVGLAAPQIGIPLRIIGVEITKNHVRAHTPEQVLSRGMEVTPLRVLINPELKVEDYAKLRFPEGCASLRALTGLVERYRSVSVVGTSPSGEPVRWRADGWAARVVQHEMDHLAGVMYLDRCEPRSVEHQHWQLINARAGRFRLLFDSYGNRQWGL